MNDEYGALKAAHHVRSVAEVHHPVRTIEVPTWLAHEVFNPEPLPSKNRVGTVTITMAVDDDDDTTITPHRAWLCLARGTVHPYQDFDDSRAVTHLELSFGPDETLPQDWISTAVSANDIRDEPFLGFSQ